MTYKKPSFTAISLVMFLFSYASSAGTIDDINNCLSDKGKLHNSMPTCQLYEKCANLHGVRNVCDTFRGQPGLHACCERPDHLFASNSGDYNGNYNNNTGQNTFESIAKTCGGEEYRKSLSDFINERHREGYKNIEAKCAPAPKSKTICCVQVKKCDGTTKKYKTINFTQPVGTVEQTLNHLPINNCR